MTPTVTEPQAAVRVTAVQIVQGTTLIDTLQLQIGSTAVIACRVLDQFGQPTNRNCNWLSLNPALASVTPSKAVQTTVRGVVAGTTRVTASISGKADTVVVVVSGGTQPPPTGVVIAVGESWQAKADAHPTYTVFSPAPGTHVRPSVVPKTGQQFRCQPGAVMDGQNVAPAAFQINTNVADTLGPFPDSVSVVGCKVINYNPPFQYAAIRVSGGKPSVSGRGWVVDSNEITLSSQVGLRVGHGMKARWNNVHHNGTFGVSGPGDDVLVLENQISDNGTAGLESGGTKFVLTNRLILRGNTVRRNHGPGLWPDIANRDFLIENNTTEENFQEGIVVEISYNGVIRNNLVQRNGLTDTQRIDNWPWSAGIGIHASGGTGIEVYGNQVIGNAHGIALIQQRRGTNYPSEPGGIDPEMYVQNVNIHDNTITLQAGSRSAIAGVDDSGTNGLYSGRNIQSNNNTISLDGRAFPFAWSNAWRSLTEWRGFGFDLNSAVTP
jgi:parallel beta-helix repeat protein